MNQRQITKIWQLSTRKFLESLASCKKTRQIKKLLRIRCYYDIALFARYFFAHHCRLSFSAMHRDLFRRRKYYLTDDILQRKVYNEAIAAPRGYAKSTVKALIFPIHDILYQQERYIIIISATLKQAMLRLKNIKGELLANKALHRIYGQLIKKRATWSARSININDVQIDAFSAGTELRGITHQEFRPTKIIIDDAEDSEEVESPIQREKLRNWFNEVIENLGDKYTRLEVIGTMLHPDSLLANLIKRPDFYSRCYSAILQFANDEELWHKWRALFTDLSCHRRLKAAQEFFEEHKPEMLKGSKVGWKEKESYYELICQLVTRGHRPFFKEKQNQPYHSEAQIFYPDKFSYFVVDGNELVVESPGDKELVRRRNSSEGGKKEALRRVKLADLQIYGFLDSALGSGDYAAIAVVGKDKFGYKYLLDMWLKRSPPTQQVKAIFDLHQQWSFNLFGIESNCFQQLLMIPLEEEREKRRQAGQKWQLPVAGIVQRENKIARINALEPLVTNGWLLFHRRLPDLFFQQCEQFPQAPHDDGLDALAAAVTLSRTNKIKPNHFPPRHSLKALNHF